MVPGGHTDGLQWSFQGRAAHTVSISASQVRGLKVMGLSFQRFSLLGGKIKRDRRCCSWDEACDATGWMGMETKVSRMEGDPRKRSWYKHTRAERVAAGAQAYGLVWGRLRLAVEVGP